MKKALLDSVVCQLRFTPDYFRVRSYLAVKINKNDNVKSEWYINGMMDGCVFERNRECLSKKDIYVI